jgi:hypothetical protein
MSIADVDQALGNLNQTIGRRNLQLDAFMNELEQEITLILDQLQRCDRAVAAGIAPPADLQRIRNEIDRLTREVERIPLDDPKKEEILGRLRRELLLNNIRRSADYVPLPGGPAGPGGPGAGPGGPGAGPSPGPSAGLWAPWRSSFFSSSGSPGASPSASPGSGAPGGLGASSAPGGLSASSNSGFPSPPVGPPRFTSSPSVSVSSSPIPPSGSAVEMGKVRPGLKPELVDALGEDEDEYEDATSSEPAKKFDPKGNPSVFEGGKTRSKRKRKSQKQYRKKTRR